MLSRIRVPTLLAGLALGLLALAGPATSTPEETPSAEAPLTAANAYLGVQVCQQCHFDRFESYQNSAHAIAGDPRTPAGQHACESCHGPGGNHVGGGGGRDVGDMMPFNDTMTAAEKNNVCLSCHSRGIVALWPGSVHETRDLACTDCHDPHSGNVKLLRDGSQPQTCTQCHRQVRAQLMRPSHHPIREGKMVCTNCHNPHGTVTEKLISATTINNKCYECHAEKRGPFLWEHPPVRESCLNCHHPHGTSHEPLLRVKRPLLCQRCHNALGHPSVLFALTPEEEAQGLSVFDLRRGTPTAQLMNRSCTNCHVNLHGSNHPSGKLFHR